MAEVRALPWGLITALGAVALVRPVLSVLDVYESGPLERPVGPLLVTVLIAVLWVAAAVLRRVPQPVETLALAGVAYGVLAIALNLVLQPLLDSTEPVPLPGALAMLVLGAVQGAVLGCVAWGLLRARTATRR